VNILIFPELKIGKIIKNSISLNPLYIGSAVEAEPQGAASF
jgi:hypothetical protein